ncbi:hypothetical protein JM79_2099 [Gramella sp. Hel_I_59]|nr:hypothetical protein JM79_2099 [Gramella sp. Hel_I_59]
MEIIFETIVILILRYPGAAIRWSITRLWSSDKKFKEFLKEDAFINGVVSLIFIPLIAVVVNTLI